MSRIYTRKREILALSHLVVGFLGFIAAWALYTRDGPPRPGFEGFRALAWAWAKDRGSNACPRDMVPWTHALVARRESIDEDDFAVEAALTLRLLQDAKGQNAPESERMVLSHAAAQCTGVLHVPCDGLAFERAVTEICHPRSRRACWPQRNAGRDAGTSMDLGSP